MLSIAIKCAIVEDTKVFSSLCYLIPSHSFHSRQSQSVPMRDIFGYVDRLAFRLRKYRMQLHQEGRELVMIFRVRLANWAIALEHLVDTFASKCPLRKASIGERMLCYVVRHGASQQTCGSDLLRKGVILRIVGRGCSAVVSFVTEPWTSVLVCTVVRHVLLCLHEKV